ncbi:hypothetical protein E4U53_007192 [Claviceps sorghi]|nr:hypothetical protein E4U53_007192 [Claviceps sorghi]
MRTGASHDDIQEAIEPKRDPSPSPSPSTHPDNASIGPKDGESGKSKTVRRVANAIKRTTRSGVKVLLKIDQARASLGQEDATNRLGALQEEPTDVQDAGPARFPARHHGQKGLAYIVTRATSPALSWRSIAGSSTGVSSASSASSEEKEREDAAAWTVPLSDIVELRKVGGLGWKSKAVVGGVLGWRVTDGLVLTTRDGAERHLTAVTRRDGLFNRLVALGVHKWEMV